MNRRAFMQVLGGVIVGGSAYPRFWKPEKKHFYFNHQPQEPVYLINGRPYTAKVTDYSGPTGYTMSFSPIVHDHVVVYPDGSEKWSRTIYPGYP